MAHFKKKSFLQYSIILITTLFIINYFKSTNLSLQKNNPFGIKKTFKDISKQSFDQIPVFGKSEFDPDGESFNKKGMIIIAVTVFAIIPCYLLL